MKLFGFFNKKKEDTKILISATEQLWVEENFQWLINTFSYPHPESNPILFSKDFFPKTFENEAVLVENILTDLCTLFRINRDFITFELHKDLRDISGMPLSVEGHTFETEVEILDGNYKIYVANFLLQQPKRLVYFLILEFVFIKLNVYSIQLEQNEDSQLFIYIAGIFFGFGVLLSQHLEDSGSVEVGMWVQKWKYKSEMPIEIMAYALALYAKLQNDNSPHWKNELPIEIKRQFEINMKYLSHNPTNLFDKNELEAYELLKLANDKYFLKEYEDAIGKLERLVELTKNILLKSDAYNEMGYNCIMLQHYQRSVEYFKSSIQMNPENAFANDNLGYALIQIGEWEEGKKWIDKAMATKYNDIAYSFRNLALYYQSKGDNVQAENYFIKSFESLTVPVDLLEYHYADFLIKTGDLERGIEFLNLSIDKGEPEAVAKMNEINKNEF